MGFSKAEITANFRFVVIGSKTHMDTLAQARTEEYDITQQYLDNDIPKYQPKRTDINVLLNRVKSNQKNEKRKKLYFSAAASTGLILFGLIIF